MNTRAVSVLIAACLAASSAQAQKSNGWADLGAWLGGEGDRVYERAYQDQMLRNYIFMNERNAYLQSQAELEMMQEMRRSEQLLAEVREFLSGVWVQMGLPESEARAVAAVFEMTKEQSAINARAHRFGQVETLTQAKIAYDEFRFLLANQLIIAAVQAVPAGAADANAAIAQLDAKYEAEDALYLVRRPLLSAEVARIKQTMPPSQWVRATAEAYEEIARLPIEEAQRRATELEASN